MRDQTTAPPSSTIPLLRTSSGGDHQVLRLLHSAPQPMAILDGAGRLVALNDRAEALLERSADDLRGRLFVELVEKADRDDLEDRLHLSISSSAGRDDMEARLLRADGAGLPIAITFLPFPTQAGTQVSILLRDLTKERAAADASGRMDEYVDALHATGLSLGVGTQLKDFLEAILARTSHLLETPHARIRLPRQDTGELTTVAATGVFAGALGMRHAPTEGFGGRVLATGATFVSHDPGLLGAYADMPQADVAAALAVPLRAGGKVVGTMELARVGEDLRFHVAEISTLERFAELASVGLENARLATLRDAAHDARVKRLAEEAARERRLADLGRLAGDIVHELRTPMTYVGNNLALSRARLARAAEAGAGTPEALRSVEEAVAAALDGHERTLRLLRDLEPVSTMPPEVRASTDLAELVMDAVRVFRGSTSEAIHVELDLESTHPVQVDRDEMARALLNLLANAAEAMRGQGRIRVSTRNRHQPPTIRITDQGPGIPADLREDLFDAFSPRKKAGAGLALPISRQIVESHGGTLSCQEGPRGRGTTFIIRLPAARPHAKVD